MPQTTTDRLIIWMQSRGLKQVDLANQMNISESTVSLIIKGRRDITDSFVGRFARTFSRDDFTEVFGGNGLPQPAEVSA